MKKSIVAIMLVCTGFATIAQQDITPKYSNEFLSIGVGASALGRSNSIVAGVDDVTAGYWNPAGLTDVKDFLQIGAMHAEYFAGIAKYDYIGIAKPIDDKSTAGFTFIRFGVDDIPNTTQLIDASGNIDYDKITTFTAGDYGFLFSYARKMPIEGLSVGGNFKVVYRHVGNFARSWGFGLDGGINYQLGEHWRFGAMIRDLTTTFNAWSFNLDDQMIETFQQTGNDIPENGLEITTTKFILGTQFKTNLVKEFYLSTEIDLDLNTDGRRNVLIRTSPVSIDPHWGIEIGYGKWVALRAGFGNLQWIKNTDLTESLTFQPNIGIGVGFKSVKIDYAFTDIGDASVALYSHVFSLRFGLSDPKEKESGESSLE
ncbi:PorV/PorQ family protein [Paracrocinitomix mangrovi]|uniref:putative type IX sorting system protein PorV2 n=1 Tax=Paracrocinitomix mangrovi TaxID=2862509 RepID=UPI001C8ED4A5|nr:PorV/PorQ family protein [Paracrocinitomix mangrovi]UKN01535.1 PorV/PorQ family protein [Paracrocinitomix mangrovi]